MERMVQNMENEVLKSPSEFDVSSAIKKWRSQGFSKEMIELARNDMAEYGMPFKQVSIYMDVKLSAGQAEQLSQALRNEVNEDFVRHLAEGGYSAEQIKTILRFTSEVPVDVIEKNVTSDMKAHAISKALQAVKDSLAEAKQAVPEENEKVKEVLDSISEQLSALSQNAELIEKVSKKLDEMPKTESVDEESIRKEYEGMLEQKEAELSTQQDQLNKLMKTKAELTRKLEQMQEENQSVSKLRESMDQEMDEYRKQKNQILDERDDALRESRNLRKEMEEMKRTIGELEKQIKERDDHAVKTRVPGMYGSNVGYIWIRKEDIMEIHNGKTLLTYLDKEKDYKIYSEDNRVLYTMKGEDLYAKHYDRVERTVRERYQKVKQSPDKNVVRTHSEVRRR